MPVPVEPMRRTHPGACLIVALLALRVASAAPSVSSVVNAASNIAPNQPNGGLAEGSIFVAYGTGLGPSPIAISPTPFQTNTIARTSITITVNGKSVDAPIYYASATQVSGMIPSGTPTGAGVLTVTYNGDAGAPAPVQIVQSNFGAFAVSQAGYGDAILTFSDNSLVSAQHAANPGDNGLYKTTNSGQTWSATLFVGIQPSRQPDSLAIDAAGDTAYAIAETSLMDGYVVKTTDSGTTWTALNLPFTPCYDQGHFPSGPPVQALIADPKISGVLYAVVDATIFKTADFGASWKIAAAGLDVPATLASGNGPITSGAPEVARLQIDPRDSQTIYALTHVGGIGCTHATIGSQCGLYRSADGGQTWSSLPIPASYTYSLGIDPGSGALYAGAVPAGLGQAVLKSTDSGSTWTPVESLGQGVSDEAPVVLVDPSAPSTIYATGNLPDANENKSFRRSTDGGATWTTIQMPTDCIAGSSPTCGSNRVTVEEALLLPPPAGPPAIAAQNGLVNGASFQPGIVANSWMTIVGNALAFQTGDWRNSIVNGALPTTLDGVSVTVGGKPAYIYYVSPTQLNVLAPDVPPGPVSVTVTAGNLTSSAVTASASLYGPAFFAWPGTQPVATRPDYSYVAKPGTFAGVTTVAAKPGDVIVLWGTGFGPTNPPAPAGMVVPAGTVFGTLTLPTVTIDNISATVYSAALTPGAAGLYQVAIQVPSSLPDGDWPNRPPSAGCNRRPEWC